MLKNYLQTAIRHLAKNRMQATINIGGLAIGMAVAVLIGLWIADELSYDTYNKNYDHIAQVVQNELNNGEQATVFVLPFPLADELRTHYGNNFKAVVMGSRIIDHVLSSGQKIFSRSGAYFEAGASELLDLDITNGSGKGLHDPNAILLSTSLAKAYFGNADPIGQSMKLDNDQLVKVTGVYKDLPANSEFAHLGFIASWQLIYTAWGMKNWPNPWRANGFLIYTLLPDHADLARISQTIRDAKLRMVHPEERDHQPKLFLHPMHRWHLYSEFKNGVNTGGRIGYVWLFGLIGAFVLLLACINFMNLSTARSEHRAKEVGVRKTLGSGRRQLIDQFLIESLVIAALSFALSLALASLALPAFNELAGKELSIAWSHPLFWIVAIGFTLFTGLLAGSYPALYLSSFVPVKVLKGYWRAGRMASLPRQVLIVVQFTVSVVLIIGTIVVFRQIQYARNRPLGYDTNRLVMLWSSGNDFHDHFDAARTELLQSRTIENMAESESYVSDYPSTTAGFEWPGMTPGQGQDFPCSAIGYDYGKTVGWHFLDGRDFSRVFASDSAGLVVNEAAVQFMGLKKPVGQIIKWHDQQFTIIGVIKNTIIESPYAPIRPFFAYLAPVSNIVTIKLNPAVSATNALEKIEAVYKEYAPAQLFNYQFADAHYAEKFGDEQRIGKLSGFFTILAIFISSLGLFGMAAFMAEQRTREIGVRKVLGATVTNLWRLLSRDLLVLVALALLIATPLAWMFMHRWLQNYAYHATLSWWIFVAAGALALLVTLMTVSIQTIKAARANPVRSLRSQ
jgi:putative ABC transport system permease protein